MRVQGASKARIISSQSPYRGNKSPEVGLPVPDGWLDSPLTSYHPFQVTGDT